MNPVTDYLPHIFKRNPLRRITDRLLDGREVGPDERERLLAALQYPAECRWRHRIVAAWALQRVPLTSKQKSSVSLYCL